MGIACSSRRPIFSGLAAALAVLVVGVGACGPKAGTEKTDASAIVDPVVAASVNGKPIFVADVEAEAAARGLIREGEGFDTQSDEFFQILEDLIERRLFSMEAEARQLDRSTDVRHRLERARELVLFYALSDQISDVALDESTVVKMYREQVEVRNRTNVREVRARIMVLDGKETAVNVKRRLEAGESFAAIAYQLSRDRTTAAEGGDLGFVATESLEDGLREAAEQTGVGQVAGPLRTARGWTLLKIEERRDEAPPSFESMRPQIERFLVFEEHRRLVEKLKASARIDRNFEVQAGTAPRGVAAPDSGARMPEDSVAMGPGGVAGATGENPASIAAPEPAAPAPAAPKRPPARSAGLPPAPAKDGRET